VRRTAWDFLLTARRDVAAARRFFERAISLHDLSEKITIDKNGAKTSAVRGLVEDSWLPIELRQSKYLNNIVEQDHRGNQTPGQAHARVEKLPHRATPDLTHRDHAHDRQGANEQPQRASGVSCTAVLLVGLLIEGQ